MNYNLTFDKIYDSIESQYYGADREYRIRERTGSRNKAVETFYFELTDFYTTLIRFKKQPEYRYAIARAVNDFHEANDGLEAYLTRSRTRRPDKVLEILTETQRNKFSDVCALFNVPVERAQTLLKVVNNIRFLEEQQC
jgi:hypothetical protein